MHKGKYRNAQKWFRIATKLDENSKEAFLGQAITSLKLGQHAHCVEVMNQRPGARVQYNAKGEKVLQYSTFQSGSTSQVKTRDWTGEPNAGSPG